MLKVVEWINIELSEVLFNPELFKENKVVLVWLNHSIWSEKSAVSWLVNSQIHNEFLRYEYSSSSLRNYRSPYLGGNKEKISSPSFTWLFFLNSLGSSLSFDLLLCHSHFIWVVLYYYFLIFVYMVLIPENSLSLSVSLSHCFLRFYLGQTPRLHSVLIKGSPQNLPKFSGLDLDISGLTHPHICHSFMLSVSFNDYSLNSLSICVSILLRIYLFLQPWFYLGYWFNSLSCENSSSFPSFNNMYMTFKVKPAGCIQVPGYFFYKNAFMSSLGLFSPYRWESYILFLKLFKVQI